MIDPSKPPAKRPGFRWEYRKGCQCKWCPWKGNCLGETWPHWIQIKETPFLEQQSTDVEMIGVRQSVSFEIAAWRGRESEDALD